MSGALQTPEEIKAAAMNQLEDSSTSNDTGETTASAVETEPAGESTAPQEPTPPAPSPEAAAATEPQEGDEDWKVPGQRFKDEVEKRKDIEAKYEAEKKAREELEAKAKTTTEPENDTEDNDEVELDPDVLKAMKKQGFLTRAEAEKLADERAGGILAADKQATAARAQAQQDKQDLTKEFLDKGYPAFEIDKVLPKAIEMVGENNINKGVLKAAYLEVHAADIEDVMVKQAAAKSTTATATAERPGGAPKVGADTDKAKTPEQVAKAKMMELA